MQKSLIAIYLVASRINVLLALKVQPKTGVANLRNEQGRTVELMWTWSAAGESCDTACAALCDGSVCDKLARDEIDSSAKMTDLELEMDTSECASYYDTGVGYGPYVDVAGMTTGNVQQCFFSNGESECSTAFPMGFKNLCACEVTLGTCTIAEDPHIRVFDEAQVSMLMAGSEAETEDELLGEKWLVKSARVKVQARFENIGGELDNKIFSRAIAISGEIMNDNVIAVGSLEDTITWNGEKILDGQESSFYMRDGAFSVNATRGSSSLVQDPSQPSLGVNIRLQSGVTLIVNRQHHYVNAAIRMPTQAGGQEGLCGNFNGLGSDDTMEMMSDRFNPAVVPEESLFAGLSFD